MPQSLKHPLSLKTLLRGFIVGFIVAMLGGGLIFIIRNSKMKEFEHQITEYIKEICQ